MVFITTNVHALGFVVWGFLSPECLGPVGRTQLTSDMEYFGGFFVIATTGMGIGLVFSVAGNPPFFYMSRPPATVDRSTEETVGTIRADGWEEPGRVFVRTPTLWPR